MCVNRSLIKPVTVFLLRPRARALYYDQVSASLFKENARRILRRARENIYEHYAAFRDAFFPLRGSEDDCAHTRTHIRALTGRGLSVLRHILRLISVTRGIRLFPSAR